MSSRWRGETAVVPPASVNVLAGFRMGGGSGGASGKARPVAVINANAEDIEVEPVFDLRVPSEELPATDVTRVSVVLSAD